MPTRHQKGESGRRSFIDAPSFSRETGLSEPEGIFKGKIILVVDTNSRFLNISRILWPVPTDI